MAYKPKPKERDNMNLTPQPPYVIIDAMVDKAEKLEATQSALIDAVTALLKWQARAFAQERHKETSWEVRADIDAGQEEIDRLIELLKAAKGAEHDQ
jgi:hypothetical protein